MTLSTAPQALFTAGKNSRVQLAVVAAAGTAPTVFIGFTASDSVTDGFPVTPGVPVMLNLTDASTTLYAVATSGTPVIGWIVQSQ